MQNVETIAVNVTGVYICSLYSILTGCYDNRVRIWRHDGKWEHAVWMNTSRAEHPHAVKSLSTQYVL